MVAPVFTDEELEGLRRFPEIGREDLFQFFTLAPADVAFVGPGSLEHLIELSEQLQAKGVDLAVLDQGIDTSTAVGRMFFQILGSIAEFEHALMSERTMDDLAAARARVRTGGQKPKLESRVQLARQRYDERADDGKRRYTVAPIAAEFGVTRPTIYRHLGKSLGPATS